MTARTITTLALYILTASLLSCVSTPHGGSAISIYVRDNTHSNQRTLKAILDIDGTLFVAENVASDNIPEKSVKLQTPAHNVLIKQITSADMNRLFRIHGGVIGNKEQQEGVTYKVERTVNGRHEAIETSHSQAPHLAQFVESLVKHAVGKSN